MDDQFVERLMYPRVTEIIGRQTAEEMRSIPSAMLQNACVRGTKLHEYCTGWVNNLFVDDIEDDYRPYFDAFKEWGAEKIKAVLSSNTRLYHDHYKFSGEFDLIVQMHSGERVLVDIKTSSSPSISWPVQLAAYCMLCEENKYELDGACILHLRKYKNEVTAREIHYPGLSEYRKLFISALECYNYFYKKEKLNDS